MRVRFVRRSQRETYREKIKEVILMDDGFMSLFFDGNTEGATLLVRIILGMSDIWVTDVRTQKDIKNLGGRSVRLDILGRDSAGRLYNIEVQRRNKGAEIKRASLHASLLVANACEPGCEPVDYPEIYVIFITEKDVVKKGRPLYYIERMLVEDGEVVDDGEHVVYVNSTYRDRETALGRLMHDFHCKDPRDMYHQVLAERVRFFKEDKEGVRIVSSVFQEVRDEGRKEGRAEGRKEGGRTEFAVRRNMGTLAALGQTVQPSA